MKTPTVIDHKIRVTITEIKGKPCKLGYEVGKTWVIAHNRLPAHFCMAAFNSIYSAIVLLRNGGSYWWSPEDSKDVVTSSCPCPDCRVQLEIRRLPME